MGSFVLPLVIIFGGWWLLRTLGNTQPKKVRPFLRKAMGYGIIVAGGFLTLKGSMNIGIPMIMLGGGLVGEDALFGGSGFKWPGGAAQQAPGQSAPARKSAMSRAEALSVLGLKAGAGEDEVRSAYKRLMKDFHPDRGGSDYLAAKINQAKDVLLQDSGPTT